MTATFTRSSTYTPWTGSTLAGRTVESVKALAVTGLPIARTAIRALHIKVSFFIARIRVLLRGAIVINFRSGQNGGGLIAECTTRHVEISLRGVDMGMTKRAGVLGAVCTLPVAMAVTSVVLAASPVVAARIGAVSDNLAGEASCSHRQDGKLHGKRR
jgi:hypothetical protein